MRPTKGPSDPVLLRQARRVGRALRARDWRVATAESCTGGLIAGAITDFTPGTQLARVFRFHQEIQDERGMSVAPSVS